MSFQVSQKNSEDSVEYKRFRTVHKGDPAREGLPNRAEENPEHAPHEERKPTFEIEEDTRSDEPEYGPCK